MTQAQPKQQPRWIVGKTQPTNYGASQMHGHSFSIQDARGAPLLNIAYATEVESKQAEEVIRKAIENAVDVMGY